MARTRTDELLLGEWACLGVIAPRPTHGFAVAAALKPSGEVGRVWSMSRPLTYRAIDHLTERHLIEPIGEEPGLAGGNRTILAATADGRSRLYDWLSMPVEHLRDLRSQFLLKLVLADLNGRRTATLLRQQHQIVERLTDALTPAKRGQPDVVALWRNEASQAALRFITQLEQRTPDEPRQTVPVVIGNDDDPHRTQG